MYVCMHVCINNLYIYIYLCVYICFTYAFGAYLRKLFAGAPGRSRGSLVARLGCKFVMGPGVDLTGCR